MELRIVALYPVRVSALAGRPGVRFRGQGKRISTMVQCTTTVANGRTVALPDQAVPEGTPTPVFRAQFEMARVPPEQRQTACILLSAEGNDSKVEPEQLILSPIFDDGARLIFEFRRAHVLTVSKRGEAELRFVAVHPVTGVVGTKTVYTFNMRFSPLANRCLEHLAGAIDLFPPKPPHPRFERAPIPAGEADLTFGAARRKSRVREDPEPRT